MNQISRKHSAVFLSRKDTYPDLLCERFAAEHSLSLERVDAEAEEVIEKSDFVLCFWDGNDSATKTPVAHAVRVGKRVKIKRIAN